MNEPHPRSCQHRGENGMMLDTWIEYDARGIPIGKVCPRCVEGVKAIYRPEVLSDPNYEADEPIEPDPEY
jgi:hypothetical protein